MHMASSTGSVSRLRLVFEITSKGSGECELVRHLAPLTAGSILKGVPLQDRVHRFEDRFVYIETGLTIGAEKQRTQFKRGEMALLTSNGALCFFLKDSTVQPMNPLGKILTNMEIIESCQPGDVLTVKKSTA